MPRSHSNFEVLWLVDRKNKQFRTGIRLWDLLLTVELNKKYDTNDDNKQVPSYGMMLTFQIGRWLHRYHTRWYCW